MTYLRNTILLSIGMIGALMAMLSLAFIGSCPAEFAWTLYVLMFVGLGIFALSCVEVSRG
jgi:hypothetical protein